MLTQKTLASSWVAQKIGAHIFSNYRIISAATAAKNLIPKAVQQA